MNGRFRDYWPLVVLAAITGAAVVVKDVLRGKMSPWVLLFVPGGAAALVLAVLGLWYLIAPRMAKTRSRDMRACSRRLGWSFEAS